MQPMSWVWLGMGLALLVVGAEMLVRGASKLALALGISPLVIGLTVVAYGTSAPELAVSVQAAITGKPDIALGNVIGSNIFNVLMILGSCAAIRPLVVSVQLIRQDVPIMIAASVALLLMSLDGNVGRIDGLILVAAAGLYTWHTIRQSRRESAAAQREYELEYGGGAPARTRDLAVQALLVVAGLAVLVGGARWFVRGSVDLARAFGLSELVIGLTIVAAGTSMPEVATSIIATVRGQRDIAIGNVVGSNIFNIFLILGLAAVAGPAGIPVSAAAANLDIPVMVAVALACLPIFFTDHLIARWEGFLLLGYYAAYTSYLILAARKHDLLPVLSGVMLGFVIPLSVLTLLVLAWRALRKRDNHGRF